MSLAEDPSLLAPKALSFQFKANRKMYSTTVHFSRKAFVPLVGKKLVSWTTNIIPVELGTFLKARQCKTRPHINRQIFCVYFHTGINGEQGVGTAVLWYV